jgi:hypothetical protein
MEAYLMAHAGRVATGGLESMMGYQTGETEKWYAQEWESNQAMLARIASDPNATPERIAKAAEESRALDMAFFRRKGLNPGEALAKTDELYEKLYGANFEARKNALVKAGDADGLRKLMWEPAPAGLRGVGGGGSNHQAEGDKPEAPLLVDMLYTPEQKAEMGRMADQVEDTATVKKYGDEMGAAFEAGDEAAFALAADRGREEIYQTKDPVRRDGMLQVLDQEVAAQQKRWTARDYASTQAFLAKAEKDNMSPVQQLEALTAAPGFSGEAKAKLAADIRKGTLNKPTPENRAALSRGRAMVDDKQLMDQEGIEGFALENGLATTQISDLTNYWRQGGQSKLLSQKLIDGIYKELTKKTKAAPPEYFDLVLGQLESGKYPDRETVKHIMANLIMDGEIEGGRGLGYGEDMPYREALSEADNAETWLPFLDDKDDMGKIDQALKDGGMAVNDMTRRIWKKAETMGLPLSAEQKRLLFVK